MLGAFLLVLIHALAMMLLAWRECSLEQEWSWATMVATRRVRGLCKKKKRPSRRPRSVKGAPPRGIQIVGCMILLGAAPCTMRHGVLYPSNVATLCR